LDESEHPAGSPEGRLPPHPETEGTDWIALLELVAGLIQGRSPSPHEARELDWFAVAGLAELQGVGPLLSLALRALPDLPVPAEVREAVAASYRDAVYMSLQRESVQRSLSQCLDAQAVPLILLKGAALAFTCYDEPATRPMDDLDVLVPRSRVEEAAVCLAGNGFQPDSGSLATELKSPRGHLNFRHGATGVPVELHWELKLLGRAQRRATPEIWNGARPAGIEGNALMMRPGHALPVLCAHMLLQHRQPRLIWLYDLHRLLLKMDAAEVKLAREAAGRWRLGPCTALALGRVHELFGTSLPEDLCGWMHQMASRSDLQARVAARALSYDPAEAPSEYLMGLLMSRNFSAWRILFPAPEDLRRRLHLSGTIPVGPGAYATFLIHRLRHVPLHLRQLWRFWYAAPQPDPAERPAALPEAPLAEE
jgi:hypothetical protein